jgi:hypothetical protein
MIYLEGAIGCTTIDTPPLTLFQKVRSCLPSGQFTTLILDAPHLSIFHHLGIELDVLDLNAYKRY